MHGLRGLPQIMCPTHTLFSLLPILISLYRARTPFAFIPSINLKTAGMDTVWNIRLTAEHHGISWALSQAAGMIFQTLHRPLHFLWASRTLMRRYRPLH